MHINKTITDKFEPPKYTTSCLICGKTIETYEIPIHSTEVCEDCKKAVAYAKKLMVKVKPI